jgi:hypothetical protein
MLLVAAVISCRPYEHYSADALRNASRRFGEQYTVHSEPEPRLASGQLHFTASYRSACNTDRSYFSLEYETSSRLGTVFVASRHEVPCDDSRHMAKEFSRRVSVPLRALPASEGARMLLALPPGSEYELWRLDAEPPPYAVHSSIAPPCPPAALRLYVHRAEPKLANPNGPCSTMLEVPPHTQWADLLALTSERLGVNVAALQVEGQADLQPPTKAFPGLADGAVLVALEAAPAPTPPSPPPPPITCCPAWGCASVDAGEDRPAGAAHQNESAVCSGCSVP